MATVASGAGRDSSRRRGTGRMNNMNNTRPPPTTNVRRNGAGSYQQNVPSEGVYGNERMLHALTNMLGYTVTLTVKNNSVYEGILNSVSPKMEINLQFVDLIQNCANGQSSRAAERGESIKSMIFNPTDIVSFCAANVDYDTSTRDNFTDAAISRNGQSVERDLKELEPWVAETDDDSLALDSGTNGWDAHDMFKRNAEQFDVKSTYDENLSQYTTPLVRKNDREYRQKEEEAERMAREIESTESYRAHSALENGDRDEETKFSSVVRPDESEPQNTGRYLPPHIRQNPNPMPAPNRQQNFSRPNHNMPQQPLPQRERRDRERERDRGWENPVSRQSMQPQGGPSPVSTQGPGPQPNMPPAMAQQRRDLADIRMNGGDNRERKSAVEAARNFNKPGGGMNQGSMNQGNVNQGGMNHGGTNQGGMNQGGMNQRPPHHVQPPMASGPSMQSGPPVATVKPQPAQHQLATSTPVPSISQPPPPSHPSMSGPVPAPTTQTQPPPAVPSEKPEPRALSPQSQPPTAERKSRDKVEDLKEFGKKFKLPDNVDDRKAERGQGEKRPEVEEKKEEEKTEVKVNENVIKSSLNPNAKEFKPACNAPTVKSVPPPSPTPPRQSPVVHPPPAMMPMQSSVYAPNQYIKVVNIPSTQSGPQRQTKRAVVSVHPDHAQLAAHHATGQPLLAQATTLPGQQFVYQIPPGLQQGGQPSFQMLARMVPPTSMHMSHQGSGMDPSQASGQTAHATQQLFGTFPLGKNDSFLPPKNFWFAPGHAPIPAHMHPGAAGMSHPQPAHTHMQHHQQHHQVPGPPGPGPQPQSGQITPHPSASPVQHMGPNGHAQPGPQPHHAHTQGAPPTSGTPQPSMNYSQGMSMQGHPPQLQPTHAHPAHSHAGHNNPNPQGLHPVSMSMTYMPHTMQASSLSQAGASGGGGGPAPAHVQHGTHAQMGQTHQVVLMPQPPPHQVNQVAAMSNHHHHHHSGQYPQHITVTGHGQVHSGGQGPHLMPGNMPTAIPVSGTGLAGMHPGQMHHAAYGPPNTAQYKHAVSHQGGHYQGQ